PDLMHCSATKNIIRMQKSVNRLPFTQLICVLSILRKTSTWKFTASRLKHSLGVILMCLINFNIGTHKKYKMVFAANRDEFYSRPTAPMSYWEDHQNILGGRGLKAKGTCLAVSTSGKIGALTNMRSPKELIIKAEKLRGELIVNYMHADKYMK